MRIFGLTTYIRHRFGKVRYVIRRDKRGLWYVGMITGYTRQVGPKWQSRVDVHNFLNQLEGNDDELDKERNQRAKGKGS